MFLLVCLNDVRICVLSLSIMLDLCRLYASLLVSANDASQASICLHFIGFGINWEIWEIIFLI